MAEKGKSVWNSLGSRFSVRNSQIHSMSPIWRKMEDEGRSTKDPINCCCHPGIVSTYPTPWPTPCSPYPLKVLIRPYWENACFIDPYHGLISRRFIGEGGCSLSSYDCANAPCINYREPGNPGFNHLYTLPKTNSKRPWKIGRAPKGNDRLATIHFQVLLLLVLGRVFTNISNPAILDFQGGSGIPMNGKLRGRCHLKNATPRNLKTKLPLVLPPSIVEIA